VWAPLVSSLFSLTYAAVNPCRVRPPCPAPPRFGIEMPRPCLYSPALIPPFNPLLTPPSGHQWCEGLNVGRYRLLASPSAPIKGRISPPEHPTPFLLTPELFVTLLRSRTKIEPPPPFTVVTLPLHHYSCYGEHPSAPPCLASPPRPPPESTSEL
jgi:hypothetical protein